MSNQFHGKSAVITGGANGIGEATARLLASRGAHVVIADLNDDRGTALADELGGAYVRTDVTREQDVEAAVAQAMHRCGRLDVMVNSAGVLGAIGSITEIRAEDWTRTVQIMLDGVFFGVKHASRAMKDRRSGSIISLSSVAGTKGGMGPHCYTAVKHAVVGLTRSAASELSPLGIRINAIGPGVTVTPLIDHLRGGREAAIEAAVAASPLGTACEASEIAATIVFLASDEACHITGQIIVVDSGLSVAGQAPPAHHSAPAGFASSSLPQ
ncbi:3-alpha-hydroxysteroid dehydrogenase [Sphingobium jiangsuense]|uniref:NAD(P)-dependent dehydrogenase (Short-subunit alcohol dehydrogenase family) n=1 Tax=Sphingobium jiangsuense TaxID=870476 RepID=A0A7W6FST5_9SPHN|nr:SDR family oxidoreductase [Sphingobium jiangsuense]MBB3928409.1 NAD(P)-dependent dehydrogenase (short-subunit alcohol dehydrogenase family) [Sphingobium jiangsuense]GLS99788.1 3-alpha-hydroxysteroid dehydrogenase [Sphingobium jiangsuense]